MYLQRDEITGLSPTDVSVNERESLFAKSVDPIAGLEQMASTSRWAMVMKRRRKGCDARMRWYAD